jgi:signal transduction histidine kinase
MRFIAFVASVVLLACLLPVMGIAVEPVQNQSAYYVPPVINESAKAELVSFVEEARNFALTNGSDVAFKAFNNPNGRFVRGDRYIFAYDFNGTLLAHPFAPNLVGRNNLDMVDLNGLPSIANHMLVAKSGGGFALTLTSNPQTNQSQLKLLYIANVDDKFWLASGIYLPGDMPLFSFQDQRRLKALVDEARDYALENGRDAAIRAFNDPKGQFVRGDLYIFASDFQGKCLALPFEPNLVGVNRMNDSDLNGVAFHKIGLYQARTGSGRYYYIYPNPADGMRSTLKLGYVEKVDDGWYVGAGIYGNWSAAQNITAMKPQNREELKIFVEEARSTVVGDDRDARNAALKKFMDLNGTWVRGDVYIFAQDFNGTCLCLPYLPEAIGTNRLNIQNDQGVYINRDMQAIALNGSGYYEYSWKNPISNQTQSKVSYVTKIDDTWYMGSGIYQA